MDEPRLLELQPRLRIEVVELVGWHSGWRNDLWRWGHGRWHVGHIIDREVGEDDGHRRAADGAGKDPYGALFEGRVAEAKLVMAVQEEAHLRPAGPHAEAHLARSTKRHVGAHDRIIQREGLIETHPFGKRRTITRDRIRVVARVAGRPE